MSFDAFTRVDSVLSIAAYAGGVVITFLREIDRSDDEHVPPARSDAGVQPERHIVGVRIVSGLVDWCSKRRSRDVVRGQRGTDGRGSVIYAPETQRELLQQSGARGRSVSGSRRSALTRHVARKAPVQVRPRFPGSGYNGTSASRPVEIRRLDGSLAELSVPGAPTNQEVTGAEFALFAQDRWRMGSRVTLEFGLRLDREDVVERANWSPRGGVALGVLPDGRGSRGGAGRFGQRTPLNVGAFSEFEIGVVTRFET